MQSSFKEDARVPLEKCGCNSCLTAPKFCCASVSQLAEDSRHAPRALHDENVNVASSSLAQSTSFLKQVFQVCSRSPTAEARRLERRQCEFKSHREHQNIFCLPSPTVEATDSKSVRSEFESPGGHHLPKVETWKPRFRHERQQLISNLEVFTWVWPNGSGISFPN